MRLKITHTTQYHYDEPVAYALQRLRLVPLDGPTQKVADWSLAIEGATEEVRFIDQFSNDTRLVSVSGEPHTISVRAAGEVDTKDTAGVFGQHRGYAPLWLFLRQTSLTEAGEGVDALLADMPARRDVDALHALMARIGEAVAYEVGTTHAATAAEDALRQGSGVCQDHSHIFLAAARKSGFPARYVSGYLMIEGTADQVASHAWAEAHVDGLGWVGFDVSNGISPDERYVRLATGLDYRDAMPISGIRLGTANERLEVRITVEQ
ncbi:MAG: transglutaminase family protein [Rhizobiaceae bacterium]|nr:transglutaminase family protein [Rhizobiaceae bacterium]